MSRAAEARRREREMPRVQALPASAEVQASEVPSHGVPYSPGDPDALAPPEQAVVQELKLHGLTRLARREGFEQGGYVYVAATLELLDDGTLRLADALMGNPNDRGAASLQFRVECGKLLLAAGKL